MKVFDVRIFEIHEKGEIVRYIDGAENMIASNEEAAKNRALVDFVANLIRLEGRFVVKTQTFCE